MNQHDGAAAPDTTTSDTLGEQQVIDLTQGHDSTAAQAGLISLSGCYDTVFVRPRPEVLPVTGGPGGLFYVGKSNSVAAPAGRGKTLLAQKVCQEEAVAGRATVFLDFEKDLPTFQVRMKALGLPRAQAGLTWYGRPEFALSVLMPQLLAHCAQHGVSTVVIDSVGGALEREGGHLSENDNGSIRSWYRSAVDPLVVRGITVVLVDHVRRADSEASSDSRNAKGAAAKLEVITGAAWMLRSQQPFSADQAGVVQLDCAKDNNGVWAERTKVTCHVTPSDGGERIGIDLQMGGALLPPPRPVEAIERVIAALKAAQEPLSRSALKAATRLKDDQVKQAVEILVAEGVVAESDGPRGARLARLVTPPAGDQLALPFES